MPIELGIWRIDEKPQELSASRLKSEKKLEEVLERDPALLDPEILIIRREVPTGFGQKIDLLGLNAGGELVVIELKRGRTSHDIGTYATPS